MACAARSFVQAVAAAQAGVSVIQPNIGRLHDSYVNHPGFPPDPKARPPPPRMPAAALLQHARSVLTVCVVSRAPSSEQQMLVLMRAV